MSKSALGPKIVRETVGTGRKVRSVSANGRRVEIESGLPGVAYVVVYREPDGTGWSFGSRSEATAASLFVVTASLMAAGPVGRPAAHVRDGVVFVEPNDGRVRARAEPGTPAALPEDEGCECPNEPDMRGMWDSASRLPEDLANALGDAFGFGRRDRGGRSS
jgi:hypothetical protein